MHAVAEGEILLYGSGARPSTPEIASGNDYLPAIEEETVRRRRPLARRRASTLRPSAVDILSRKPCLLTLFLFEGWNVLFIALWCILFYFHNSECKFTTFSWKLQISCWKTIRKTIRKPSGNHQKAISSRITTLIRNIAEATQKHSEIHPGTLRASDPKGRPTVRLKHVEKRFPAGSHPNETGGEHLTLINCQSSNNASSG